MPILNGVTYTEFKGSPTLSLSNEDGQGTRILDCAWTDRFTLAEALLGTYLVVGGILISYSYPDTFPGYPTLVANNVAIAGLGEQSESVGVTEYPYARLTITYKPVEWEDGDEEEERVLSTEQYDFSVEFMEVPGFSYEWEGGTDDGKVIPQKIGMLVPMIDHTITRHNLDNLPKAEISARLGATNDDTFLGVGAGMIIFAGASAQRKITTRGTKPYELTMVFKERPEVWNTMWNQTDRVWQSIDPNLYEIMDLDPLLDSRAEETT